MKNIRPWITVVGAGAALSAVTALSAQSSQAATQLEVDATTVTSAFAIPCPTCVLRSTPEGAHTGGTEYDAGTIADLSGRQIGSFVIEETGMTPFNDGPGRIQLFGTLVVGGDQLTFQGVEEPPLDGGSAAITGGTGRFASARGEITYTDISDTVTRLHLRVAQ